MHMLFMYTAWVMGIGLGGAFFGRGLETHDETLQLVGVALFAAMAILPPAVFWMLGSAESRDE